MLNNAVERKSFLQLIFEWLSFSRRRKVRPISLVKHLMLMANVDGEYHPQEDVFLKWFAQRSGISKRDLLKVKSWPSAVDFKIPAGRDERFFHLFCLIEMIMADQKIREEEIILCQRLASELEFEGDVIDELIHSIRLNIAMGHGVSETMRRVAHLIKFKSVSAGEMQLL